MLYLWTTASGPEFDRLVKYTLLPIQPTPVWQVVPLAAGLFRPEEGDVCLGFGTKAVEQLRAIGVVPKNRTVTSLRGRPFSSAAGGKYLLTFDPAILDIDAGKREEVVWDLKLAERLHRTGGLAPVLGRYSYVSDFSGALEAIDLLFARSGKPVPVALDLETVGLHPWYKDKPIVSVAVSVVEGASDVLLTSRGAISPEVCNQLQTLLTSPKVNLRGANLKFDLVWLAEKWGLSCTNFKFDTVLVGSLLDENRSNSLKAHACIYTDMGGYEDVLDGHDKGRMDLVPKDKLLAYAGPDTDATLRVSNLMKGELLADGEMTRFYTKLLHPAARAFEKIERRGVLVDRAKYVKLSDEIDEEIRDLERQAVAMMPGRLKAKYADNLKLSRPVVVAEYFFGQLGLGLKPIVMTEKGDAPSTAHSHLQMFADVPEAKAMCDLLEKLNQAKKTQSTYCDGFLKHLRPDGRFHATYYLGHMAQEGGGDDGGTVTGRLSATDPAVQTLPKRTKYGKRLRACYVAPKGKKILNVDMSQGELRIIADQAPEMQMRKVYADGLDLHAMTGSRLAGYEIEEFLKLAETAVDLYELHRSRAKAANFGLCFGMQAEGFRVYAWKNYGLKLTIEESEAILTSFFDTYPGLHPWHDRTKAEARRYGFIRSPLGRIRHLPLIKSRDRSARSTQERQAVNFPIQSTLSDMMLLGISILEEMYGDGDLEIVMMTHDSLTAYVPEDDVLPWAARITEVLENLPLHEFDWNPQVKFIADAEWGTDMAGLKKLKPVEYKLAA